MSPIFHVFCGWLNTAIFPFEVTSLALYMMGIEASALVTSELVTQCTRHAVNSSQARKNATVNSSQERTRQ